MKRMYSHLKDAFDCFLAGGLTPEALKPVAAAYGIYQQRNGNFMVRTRINGGEIACGRLSGLADILDAAGGYAHLTSRQDLQLHDIPAGRVVGAVLAADRLGLPFKGGGGNTYRNTVVGPDSGLGEEAVFDVYPYAQALNRAMQDSEKAFALPRKFKVGFFANDRDRLRASVQDLGFVAQIRGGTEGFTVYAGGGMGRESSAGLELLGFLPGSQVVRAALALLELFYDHGDRANRQQARLRFVLKRMGAEAFQRLYLEYFARTEAPPVRVSAHDPSPALLQGLKRGRATEPAEGFAWWVRFAASPTRFGADVCSVRLFVPYGNLAAGQLRKIAALSDEYGSPSVRLLATQDILIPLVHRSSLPGLHRRLRQELADIDLTFASYKGHLVTCVGAAVCKIGVAEAPAVADVIAAELDRYLPPDTPAKMSLLRAVADELRISGCPNACSGHPAAKFGIQCLKRREGEEIKTFGLLFAGAGIGADGRARLSAPLTGEPVPLERLAQKVAELVARGV
ncbi:MAG: Sulfite reductase (NADPH) hemoprotein beta-component [Verrucomicrobia bacterium ADurb.Bin345]|nr:MAG: Sulfite reductase (NADPH) hemoprotein beta-component [Verrucomicrobia bacterium ADurb.Bin345]